VSATLRRRIGFEIELLAPAGVSRHTLALDLAERCGGAVHPVWHHDSEPSLVPGLERFLHLSQGFEVRRDSGELVGALVDDVTLLADLNPHTRPTPGWFRILTDDSRLLSLLAQHSDPGGAEATALDAAGKLWGVGTQQHDDVFLLADARGATIAMAAPQGGERERPCEIVTPPLSTDHGAALEALLGPARELGFVIPREAAVHLHFDGAPFRKAAALANVIRLFAHWREPLRNLLSTNPACRRLGPLPAELVAVTEGTPSFTDLKLAAEIGRLTKFFDINLTQLFAEFPIRDTIEVRILPGAIEAGSILAKADLIERLLDRCEDPTPIPLPPADTGTGSPSSPGPAEQELLRLAATR
jgi:hypothetical protein